MKLSDIAKQVLSEDTWGTNPAAAAPSNPGMPVTAKSPVPQENSKFYDVMKDFQTFTTTIDAQEERAKKDLDKTLSKSLLNKEIVARASKGSVGQAEKDYTINVVGIDVTYLKDAYYIVIKGDDKSDYYVNTGFKIKVNGPAKKKGSSNETPSQVPPTQQPQNQNIKPQQPSVPTA